jgi:hypothetical protein
VLRSIATAALAATALTFLIGSAQADDKLYQQGVKSTVWIAARLEGNLIRIGSGALVDAEKKIVVTDYHLIMNNKGITVFFPKKDDEGKVVSARDVYMRAFQTGEEMPSTVFAEDKAHNLALLQIPNVPDKTPAFIFAKSTPAAGDKIHSIGSPGNQGPLFIYVEGTVKQSITQNWRMMLGPNMTVQASAKMIEPADAMNAGDGGGPLLNDRGELVGISRGGDGTSFFIDAGEIVALLKTKMIEPVISKVDPEPAKPKPEAMAKLDPKDNKKKGKGDMNKKPDPKAKPDANANAADPAKREAEASLKLDEAKKASSADRTLELYREIVRKYTGTKAAAEAQPLLEKLETDKKEDDAYNKLDLAKDLIKTGKKDKANERLREILKSYPGTKAADEAKKLLDM